MFVTPVGSHGVAYSLRWLQNQTLYLQTVARQIDPPARLSGVALSTLRMYSSCVSRVDAVVDPHLITAIPASLPNQARASRARLC